MSYILLLLAINEIDLFYKNHHVQNYINILCYLINDSNNVVMVTVILC